MTNQSNINDHVEGRMGFYEDAINEARRREAESEEHRTRIEKERRETNERYRRAGELKLRQWFDSIGMTPHPVFTATEPVTRWVEDKSVTFIQMKWSYGGYEYNGTWYPGDKLAVRMHIANWSYDVTDKASIGSALIHAQQRMKSDTP
jgi:hypothetical protein